MNIGMNAENATYWHKCSKSDKVALRIIIFMYNRPVWLQELLSELTKYKYNHKII